MCKKEKIKIMLDFYKSIILALLTALFGVLGYTFINYKNYSYIDIFIVIISISILFISLMIFVIIFLKEAKRLGD